MTERVGSFRTLSPVRLKPAAVWLAVGLALAGLASSPVRAQLAPRLTAQVALGELGTANTALATATKGASGSPLASVQRQLASMADVLRQDMGSKGDKPVALVGDALRARVLRAHAAAARVQAYVTASSGCLDGDAAAMQSALAEEVKRLASASDSAKVVPVIDGVESMANQPLFALRRGGGALAFALTGTNLADAQCPDLQVTATDATGKALPTQPLLTGAVPGRIELKWPEAGSLPEGNVVLHVATRHKVFLLGCKALPEASAVLRVASAVRFEVGYTLEAICPGSGSTVGVVALGHGKLPVLKGYGATVSQTIDTSACAEPQSYRLSATVTQGDGSRASAGPFTQSAQASITAGLPGGLSMSWNPAAQTLFVRSGASVCKGVR